MRTSDGYDICEKCGVVLPCRAHPTMTPEMMESVRRLKAATEPVPLSDAEKLPDPDHGF